MVVAVISAQCDLHCEQKWKINNGREMAPGEELFGSECKSYGSIYGSRQQVVAKSMIQACCPFCYTKYLMFRDKKTNSK